MIELYNELKRVYLDYDYDADVDYFAREFDEPIGSTILEIGANEEPVANVLAALGYNVIGVDFRDYIPDKRKFGNLPLNFTYIKADFNTLNFEGKVDAVFSLSTIEHFGLDAYGVPANDDADIIAMKKVWDILKPDGKVYITVPVGSSRLYSHRQDDIVIRDTRCYNVDTLFHRIINSFTIEKVQFFCSAQVESNLIGSEITSDVAFRQNNENATVLLVLRKGK